MNTQDRSIGVLIVTWNRKDEVLDCISSVLMSDYPKLSVYVVDNASEDSTVDAISNKYPEVILLKSSENLGFAGGNNLGLARVLDDEMDAVFLLNDDAVVAQDTISKLSDNLTDDVGITAPKILVHSMPDTIWAAGGMIDSNGIAFQRCYAEKDMGQAEKISDVDYAVGCAMLIRADVIRQVGMFDERYYMYYEETDWCRRIRDAGYRILYVPQSKSWHKVELFDNLRNHSAYYCSRNRLLYLSSYSKQGKILKTAVFDIMRSAAAHAVKGRISYSRMLAKGVIDYYSGNFGKLKT